MPTLSVITPNRGDKPQEPIAMKALSEQTVVAYGRRMERAGVGPQDRAGYFRWVRFYLDFCQKYGHPPREEASSGPFLAKLESKNQPEAARRQASQAIQLLLERGTRPAAERGTKETCDSAKGMEAHPPEAAQTTKVSKSEERPSASDVPRAREAVPGVSTQKTDDTDEGPRGFSWEQEYRELEGAIKLRNYSGKTYAVYRMWTQRFQAFTRSIPPGGTGDRGGEGVPDRSGCPGGSRGLDPEPGF